MKEVRERREAEKKEREEKRLAELRCAGKATPRDTLRNNVTNTAAHTHITSRCHNVFAIV